MMLLTVRLIRCRGRAALLLGVLCGAPRMVAAQSGADWHHQLGVRTTVMATSMDLSALGAGFRDLPAGGKRLAHSSSLFIVWSRGRHFRVGVETLVGNSYGRTNTGILFQAAGMTAEYQTAGLWFVAFGVQGGAMIATATQPADSTGTGAQAVSGSYYKGSGLFAAPHVSLGRRLGRREVRVLAKQVLDIPGSKGLDAFDSIYIGVSFGLKYR